MELIFSSEAVPGQFVTGGACQHFICLTADVNVFRQVWGEDATEIVSRFATVAAA